MAALFSDTWRLNDDDDTVQSPEDCSANEVSVSAALNPSRRVRCAAHTLQLAVNGALREDDEVQQLLTVVNKVVNCFRRSHLLTAELKQRCGKDLVQPGGTRWNSILAALSRLTEEQVFSSVDTILQEHDESHPSKAINMIPPVVTLPRLKELRELLQPFGLATDRLQGDGVTSCTLHLCIATCYISVDNLICEHFLELQMKLLAQLTERFREPLKNAYIIAASVLNPRQKLRCFQPTFAPLLSKPTAQEATASVNALFDELRKTPDPQPGPSHVAEGPLPPSGGDDDPLYTLLDDVSPATTCHKENELDLYLKAPYSAEDPLTY
ncbi:uncharacterized protein LOC135386411 [Ornithodoros turicata]|uniref:uncharacterized protein LOC135386411 n=1 Tax=Ornithodoros turicata TaxID=34597 RepID=UPI00313A210E